MYENANKSGELNPFRAPEPLPILTPRIFVPKNGLPVVKALGFILPYPPEDKRRSKNID